MVVALMMDALKNKWRGGDRTESIGKTEGTGKFLSNREL